MSYVNHVLTMEFKVPTDDPNDWLNLIKYVLGGYSGSDLPHMVEVNLYRDNFMVEDGKYLMVLEGDPQGLEKVPRMVSSIIQSLCANTSASWSIKVSDIEYSDYERASNGTF